MHVLSLQQKNLAVLAITHVSFFYYYKQRSVLCAKQNCNYQDRLIGITLLAVTKLILRFKNDIN